MFGQMREVTEAARAGEGCSDCGNDIGRPTRMSTSTMTINEAVNRLRGDPKTEVTLHIHRDGKDGWTGNKPFKLVREEIRVSSVESKALADGVGYVRLKQFAEQTTAEASQAPTRTSRKPCQRFSKSSTLAT